MGYSGLVASEHTTGNRVQRGGITKTGNGHLRRVVVEAAWAYQHRPNVIGHLARRQKDLAISEEAKQIAWKAQHRLHKRYKAMAARGKNKNQIVAALGRELLGFPTDHDHAVPTREYQSDQSSRMLLGCHRPCCPKTQKGTKPTVSFPFGIPILPSTRL